MIMKRYLTLKEWRLKYPAIESIFVPTDNFDALDCLFPQDWAILSVTKPDFMFEFLYATQHNRVMALEFKDNPILDAGEIADFATKISFKALTLTKKYDALNTLCYQLYDMDTLQKIMSDYRLTRNGSYTDDTHTYTGNGVGSNRSTMRKSQEQKQTTAYTYNNEAINADKITTDYQHDPSIYANETDTSIDIYNDRTVDYGEGGIVEEGHRNSSLVKEFPDLLKFLDYNLFNNWLNEVTPVFMLNVYCD